MAQHTYQIQSTAGMGYLILEDGDNINEVFELYQNDELIKEQSFYHGSK